MAELRTAQAEPRVTPRRLHALRIELGGDGEGGGHVVHHEYRGGPEYMGSGEEEGPHIFGADDGEKLMDHIKKHAKVKIKKGEEEEMEDEKDSPRKSNKKHEERELEKDEESAEDTEENEEGESEGDK